MKYVDIKIPMSLGKKIDNYIETSDSAFRSRAEFVVYLIRLFFEKPHVKAVMNGGEYK